MTDTQVLPAPTPGTPKEPRRPAGRHVVVTLLILALAGGAAATGVELVRHRPGAPTAPAAAPATAVVTRTDLRQYQQVDGTLGYADSSDVPAPHGTPASGGTGTLTWLPAVGDRISQGQRVYEVDGRPVPLLYGAVPLWRTLRVGVADGADVREIKRALRALGYGPDLADDSHYSQATADAVSAWQGDLGRARNGELAPGDVVVEPAQVRVTSVHGVLGAAASGVLLSLSSTRRQVAVQLPVEQQQLAKVGAAVTVALPGGGTTAGRITWVGTVATGSGGTAAAPAAGSTAASGSVRDATLPVRISLDKPSAAGNLDGAPVTVSFTSAVHRGVLAVPVSALLALASGGYAVEPVRSGTVGALIPVTPGMFANGQVEVDGAGLAEGLRVEVPTP